MNKTLCLIGVLSLIAVGGCARNDYYDDELMIEEDVVTQSTPRYYPQQGYVVQRAIVSRPTVSYQTTTAVENVSYSSQAQSYGQSYGSQAQSYGQSYGSQAQSYGQSYGSQAQSCSSCRVCDSEEIPQVKVRRPIKCYNRSGHYYYYR